MQEDLSIPRHVAIILDGNGRWAKKRGLPRNMGHVQGAKNVEKICRAADALGVKYITMYAFSTENWNRPREEVDALMKLLHSYLKNCLKRANKDDMRVRVIGDRSRLDDDVRKSIQELEEGTRENQGLNFQIALNYGGRDELVRATRRLAEDVEMGKRKAADITEATITEYLDTADIPDPDLLIRPSGELRLSNFLLWQVAYSEFYFSDVLWPDFTGEDLKRAILAYNDRDRRFGKVEEKE